MTDDREADTLDRILAAHPKDEAWAQVVEATVRLTLAFIRMEDALHNYGKAKA